MPYLAKRKRAERAHRYRVLAQQLEFHLSSDKMTPKAEDCVQTAKRCLLEAAAILEQENDKAREDDTSPP